MIACKLMPLDCSGKLLFDSNELCEKVNEYANTCRKQRGINDTAGCNSSNT